MSDTFGKYHFHEAKDRLRAADEHVQAAIRELHTAYGLAGASLAANEGRGDMSPGNIEKCAENLREIGVIIFEMGRL